MWYCSVEFQAAASADQRCYMVNCDKLSNTLPAATPQWNLRRSAEEIYQAVRRSPVTPEKPQLRRCIRRRFRPLLKCLLRRSRRFDPNNLCDVIPRLPIDRLHVGQREINIVVGGLIVASPPEFLNTDPAYFSPWLVTSPKEILYTGVFGDLNDGDIERTAA